MPDAQRRARPWLGRALWFLLGGGAALAGAWKVTPAWSHLVLGSKVIEVFLLAVLAGYAALLILAALGVVASLAFLTSRWGRGRFRRAALRTLAFGLSSFVAVLLAEGAAALLEARARRPPEFSADLPDGPPDEIDLVVVGESSAFGEPFVPYLSVGQIVAWKLEQALGDGRRVRVEMLAEDGLSLQQSSDRLHRLARRPDAVVVYAGHNEFQSRIPWSREVEPDGRSTSRLALGYNPWRSGLRPPAPLPTLRIPVGLTPITRTIARLIDKNYVYSPPPVYATRPLVDRPAFTHAEHDAILAAFERRLEAVVAFCERAGAIPILVIPPANETRFGPNRSILPHGFPPGEVAAFERDFLAARRAERDPDRALGLYRELLARHPAFAESHYRLARLFEARGDTRAAAHHARMALDLDAWPIRCTTPFQDAYRAVARRHPDAILIDGPAVLRARSPDGLLGETLFVDPHHPTLVGHAALAEAILRGLRDRGAWGWPDAADPAVDPAECAAHFGLGPDEWASVARRPADFLRGLAYVGHDPTERLSWSLRYLRAIERLGRGWDVDELGVPSLGTRSPADDPARPELTSGSGSPPTRRP